ncbi:uroporphyrinogen-III synthase [Muricauda sp. JGD-17]|uniref:Uroporphyrinogen-III synthase n=1 Tax=Flagellimonas ochracea TaxID=2696472 RepID=A0A964TAZ6_9FLAO|nr:uroporphyrinogen-III synthase [Allomuricauda ochracea]NAY91535.1 uroporphyrinogen-III synthase [Allomuricauda ochracea]
MKTVLSTKILTPSQKELFLNSGLGLVEYDALRIELSDVEIPLDNKNFIFTSKNAVKAFLSSTKSLEKSPFRAFCVGSKTAHLLIENGLNVVKMEENASNLASFISKNHKNEAFLFLCGNLRRNELPEALLENNIRYKEIEVYRTHLVPKAFNQEFDAILFFSPSGIKSYLSKNVINNSMLFCIGDTTASEAKKHSNNISVANKPTVENLLVQAIKHFKKND